MLCARYMIEFSAGAPFTVNNLTFVNVLCVMDEPPDLELVRHLYSSLVAE